MCFSVWILCIFQRNHLYLKDGYLKEKSNVTQGWWWSWRRSFIGDNSEDVGIGTKWKTGLSGLAMDAQEEEGLQLWRGKNQIKRGVDEY